MLDAHTLEGKRMGQNVTIIGGQYHNHLKLAGIVTAEGWEGVRNQVHAVTAVIEPPHRQIELPL